MPSINSTEDLLNLLESNEEFRNAVRRWVLGDELLAVPETLRAIQETQRHMAALLEQVVSRLDQHETRLAAIEATQRQVSALLEQMQARQDQHETRLASIEATQQRMTALLEQMQAWQEQAETRLASIEATQQETAALLKQVAARLDALEARQEQHETRLVSIEATQQETAALLKQVAVRLDALEARQERAEAWQERADERQERAEAWQERAEAWQERADQRQERAEAWQERADQRFDRMDKRMDQMDNRFDQMDNRFDQVDSRMDQMDGRMDNIETSLRDVKRHSDSMWGEWVERKAADKLVPYIGNTYKANRVYPFWGEHGAAKDFRREAFEDAISDAEDNGSIHHDEAFRLRETDLVIRARRKTDGAILWFVVEASGTLDDDDIERVERSAVALRKIYPHDEIAPLLFGYRISDRYQRIAADGNIQVVLTDG